MGFFDRLLGREDAHGTIRRDGMYVIRKAEIAAGIAVPQEANFGIEGPQTCKSCGQSLVEVLITTGGRFGDVSIWREYPIAVDGWVCARCGVLQYPRKLTPEQMTEFGRQGAAAARASQFDDAEWWFTRIVWNWPQWAAGMHDLAAALTDSIRTTPDLDSLERHRRRERARTLFDAASAAVAAAPDRNPVEVAALAHLQLAEFAIEDRAFDRARREIEACLALRGITDRSSARAKELSTYIEERRDLFKAACDVLNPFIDLQNRPTRPVASPEERAAIVKALEQLAEHYELAPHRWQAAFMLAKGRATLGVVSATLDAWKTAHDRHPGEREIAREYSLALLRAGRVPEATEVARAITKVVSNDATLWCNRAVVELLSGDIAEAKRCLDKSDRLDPNDRVAASVRKRIGEIESGSRALPRTLGELERGR